MNAPCRYRLYSHADLPRAAPADEGRDLRGRRARAPSDLDGRRLGRRARGATSGRRATSRAPSTSRAATSSRAIEGVAPDETAPVVLYCAVRQRARRSPRRRSRSSATRTSTRSPAGSPTGSETATRSCCRARSRRRSARATRATSLIPEIGEEGQLKLLDSRILLIGAGGLGSPASLYLAAAGVGTLGIVDADIVDETNLQRQIAHSLDTLGTPKVDSAKRAIEALNPDVEVVTYRERLTSENIDRILDDGWDIIVDGADNFPTRYLVNDASVWRGIPVVHGSIYRFEGQVTVFKPHDGPCYRCLFPEPPPPELAPSCAEGGVLGVLPGIVGTLQTNEAIKLAAGIGEPLVGRLLLFDALATEFNEVQDRAPRRLPRLRRPPDDHRVHRLRRVLRAVSVVRGSARAPRRRPAARARSRPPARPCASCSRTCASDCRRSARASTARARSSSFVNVYVDGEDVRTRDGLEHARARRLDGDPAAGDGRRLWPLARCST